jgi:hypothetical protein
MNPLTPEERMETHFLNVDLEFANAGGAKPIADALVGPTIILNDDDDTFRALELLRPPQNVAEAVASSCDLLEGLPPDAGQLWRSCHVRRMNIGIQAAHVPHASEFPLNQALMLRLAKLEADIVFTIYAPISESTPAGPRHRTS